MAYLRISLFTTVFFLSLCNVAWSASSSQDGGRCRLKTIQQFTFVTDVVDNGVTYNDVSITFNNEYRGVNCKQASSGSSNSCESMHRKQQVSLDDVNGNSWPALEYDLMCVPSVTAVVTKTKTVTLGGNSVDVQVRWTNITECLCSSVSLP